MIVGRSPDYQFAPSFLWVMTGARRPGRIIARRARLRRAGIEIVQAEVPEIDVTGRRVKTSGAEIGFDRLVIALGAGLARRQPTATFDGTGACFVEFATTFTGRPPAQLDLTITIDRTTQLEAITCHTSQATRNPVLWRRLELLGDAEHLRYLHKAQA